MNYPESELFDEAKKRFMESASYIETELKKLYEDGVLTKTDWMKLVEDAKLSGQAVLNAINRTDYPPAMQKELVKNLLAQYEDSMQQILNDAGQRRYSPERIDEKLNHCEQQVYTNWENAYKARVVNQRQYQDVTNRVKAEHRDILNGIRSIPSRHPKKAEMIDSWLDEYKKQMEKLAVIPTPQLDYAPSRTIARESHINTNRPPTTQQQPLKIKVDAEKKNESFLQKIWSLFKN